MRLMMLAYMIVSVKSFLAVLQRVRMDWMAQLLGLCYLTLCR